MLELVHVAVGILLNKNRQVFIAKRPEHVHLGGYWEFPGGKVERGETVHQALQRELQEELGITPLVIQPFLRLEHEYPERLVVLESFCIDEYSGVAHGKENQPTKWVNIDELSSIRFPEVNQQIVEKLQTRTQSHAE